MRIGAVAVLVAIALAAPALATPFWVKPVRISAIAINCSRDGDAVPTVGVGDDRSAAAVTSTPQALTVASIAYGVHRLDFDLKPGGWIVRIAGASCASSDDVTVLSAMPRHLVFDLNLAAAPAPGCTISGRLPWPWLTVRVINSSGRDEPVVVDGDAYYSEPLGHGRYQVEISVMQRAKVDLPVDLSGPPSGACTKKIERDITLNDLRSAMP
jgi:hypothetical protein